MIDPGAADRFAAPSKVKRGVLLRRLKAWYDHARGGRTVLLGWILTRALMMIVFGLFESFIVGDVTYYWRKIAAMLDVGLAHTLTEYPTPVAWILSLPYAIAAGDKIGYVVAFVVLMMLLDAGFTYLLWRTAGRGHDRAITFWLLFVLFIGPLAYLRFDMLPAVLAGAALLFARRRAWVTGALTGLGAAVKLWPALLLPAFLAYKPGRRVVAATFVGVGLGLAALSLLAAGWTRLISPLSWQSGRGLQIESIWAIPLMVARVLDPTRWPVALSRFQAYEVFGPGVGLFLGVSTVATVLGLLVIVALYVRAFRAGNPSAVAIGLAVLAIVAVMIVTNKTLSPQYLLWLGGPMAALLLDERLARARGEPRLAAGLSHQLLVLAALTQLVYPVLYDGYIGRHGQAGILLGTVADALRNLALLAFSVEVCWRAWRLLQPIRLE